MSDAKAFFKLLFDDNEAICTTNIVQGILVHQIPEVFKEQFFCINPLSCTRKDANVATFRNILLEFDEGTSGQQLAQIATIPHSTLVWSGNKSFHCIISLETPCTSRAEYDALVSRIYAKVPTCDRSARNPSRLSRTPNAIRDNGHHQTLHYVGTRVTQLGLDAWLGPAPVIHPRPERHIYARDEVMLPLITKHYLAFGSQPGQRNADLFKAACDLARAGFEQHEVLEMVDRVADLTHREMLQAVQSAFRTARALE